MRRTTTASYGMAALVAFAVLVTAMPAGAVVGGYEPFPNTYPWMVRLERPDGRHLCGGALLNDRWVLTAAHCFKDFSHTQITVVLGDHKRSWPDPGETESPIASYVPHPYAINYKLHDIALIRLSEPVEEFTDEIQPIALGAGDYADGTMLTAMGWGITYPGQSIPSQTDALQAVELPVLASTECTWVNTMPSSMFCAGTWPVGDPATGGGDSGGPLVIDDPEYGMRLVGVVSQGLGYGPGAYIRVRDYVPWIESVIGTRPPVCSGRSGRSDLDDPFWVQEDGDTIRAQIDTSTCAWTGYPIYFTSLGGTGGHFTTEGVTSIVHATQTSFFVYVTKPGVTVADAEDRKWHVNWTSMQMSTNEAGAVCSGASLTNTWQVHDSNTIYMQVDTSHCNFGSTTPSYFTSLYGTSGHMNSIGATSIYSPTPTGFRVYVKKSGVTPAYAAGRSWRIIWRGEPQSVSYEDVCNGKTTAGSTNWTQYNPNTVVVNVDTSACDLATIPKYFTVLRGTSQHYNTQGVTSIYAPTSTGFRVYVVHSGITPTEANTRNWHVVWNARP